MTPFRFDKEQLTMEPKLLARKHTEKFVEACEDIHALLESGQLSIENRDVILITAHDLLTELRVMSSVSN